jgi:hypothetical protein
MARCTITFPWAALLLGASLGAGLGACASSAASAGPQVWSFEEVAPGAAPAGFQLSRTGGGRDGQWGVERIGDAPDGRQVLVQRDADATDDRFPLAIANEPAFTDLRLSVRGRLLSGEVDQVFGLVFRCLDADNYYLTRANALEENVRLYHVTGGRRQQIGHWKGKVTPGEWHELEVEARGDHLQVSFDGERVIDVHDGTLTQPGRVGVWTKADAVTQFDVLRAESLGP